MSICCIEKSLLPEQLAKGVHVCRETLESFFSLDDCVWIDRKKAEQDFRYIQIIPYAVIVDVKGLLVCYQRHGNEKRITGLWSCGVGGHIEEKDKGKTLRDTLLNGLQREMNEELKEFNPRMIGFSDQGIIIEDKSKVGLCHIGCVYRYDVSPDEEPLLPDEELLNMQMLMPMVFLKKPHEYWSELAIDALKGEVQ